MGAGLRDDVAVRSLTVAALKGVVSEVEPCRKWSRVGSRAVSEVEPWLPGGVRD